MIETLIASDPLLRVRDACAAFTVSESGFYAHRRKAECPRRQEDARIAHEMKEVFDTSYHCYGSPRLLKALRRRGVRCGKARIRRLMRREGLCPRQKRRFHPRTTQSNPRTTQSNPHLPCAPNIVGAMPAPGAPAERFHSDITYIPTQEGFVFLAATLDAFTRRCAGWCARDNMETQLVKDAAHMAFCNSVGCDPIHHSDRGCQYSSESFRRLLEKEGIIQSMSRKANCYDNALSESFWATVKTECFDNFRSGIPQTRAEVIQKLFHYIELFYNRERLHSALGYKSPMQFESHWTKKNFTG
jgi:putative transposase